MPRWCPPISWRSPRSAVWSTDHEREVSAVEAGRTVTVAVSATSANLGRGSTAWGSPWTGGSRWTWPSCSPASRSRCPAKVQTGSRGREPLDHPIDAGRAGRPRSRCPGCGWPGTTPSRTAAAWGPPPRRSWPAWSRRPAGRVDLDQAWVLRTPTPSRATRTTWRPRRTAGWSWRTRARTGSRPFRPAASGDRRRRAHPRRVGGDGAGRGLLPEQVPHVDAAANAGRAALLVHALADDPTGCGTPRGLAAPALPGAGHAAVVRPGHRVARRGFRRGDQRGRSVGPRARPSHPARRPGGVSGTRFRGCGAAAPEPARQSWKPITTGILAGVLAF